MPKLCSIFFVDFDTHNDERRDARRFVREKIVDNLNEHGRSGQTIIWVEGYFEPGMDWPLRPEYETNLWKIMGYCNVLPKKIEEKRRVGYADF